MSGMRDESLLLDDVVGAVCRLIEIGRAAAPGSLASSSDAADAALWNLALLGEASERLSPATHARFDDVPWSDFARTRDIVLHHYEGVRWDLVEETVRDDLPPLARRLESIRNLLRAEYDGAQA